jgi:signal transduction histidine kinase
MTGRVSRSLAITLVVMLAGSAFLVVRTVAGGLPGGQTTAAVLATAVVALLFLPLNVHVERLVERLLGRNRPTSEHVLADLTTLARATSADASNLAGVAEAIGRRLGACRCRLIIVHPGLRDRIYAWTNGDAAADASDDIVLPIRQDAEHIGTIAVDRATVESLHNQGRPLVEEIASSLGAIVQVNRLGIELERQLRAALAHAEDIAISRRQAVAEMDNERRRLERNLHDGAQHHLVSLRMTLGLVEHQIGCGQLEQARDRLEQLATQIGSAQAVLAETAAGVSSILLSRTRARRGAQLRSVRRAPANCRDVARDALRLPFPTGGRGGRLLLLSGSGEQRAQARPGRSRGRADP